MKIKLCMLTLVQLTLLVAILAITAASAEVSPNPELYVNGSGGTCGLDIVIIVDSSDSLSSSDLQDVRDAANTFVTSLADTGSNFSVIDFDTEIKSTLPFTDDISAVTAAINSIGHDFSTELTNWHAAFTQAHLNILAGDDPNHTNLVVIITDGDPTTYGYPTSLGSYGGVEPDAPDIENAILAANALKDNGTRIISVGVTSSPTLENLVNISGPNVDTGDLTTDVITTDIGDLADALADFSQLCCGQTDISIAKSDSSDLVYPGDSLTYTIEVTNHGGHAAYDISVVDELPAEVVFVDASPAPTSGSYPTYTWEIPSVLVGETFRILVNVTINESAGEGTITNTVYVNNNTYDPNLDNNTAIEETTVNNGADLAVVKSCDVSDAYPGDLINYTIDLNNYGPNNAVNVVLTDTLPDGVSIVDIVPYPDVVDGSNLEWHYPILENGITGHIIITALVEGTAPDLISNVVDIESDTFDIDLENNEDSVDTNINNSVDLEIVKNDNIDPAHSKDIVTYSIQVTNNGPDIANNVNITDTLPAGMSYVSANPLPSGNNSLKYWWNIPSMGVSEVVDISLDVLVDGSVLGTLSNVAKVNCETLDSDPGNNVASESTFIIGAADLAVVKSDSKDPVYPYETLIYNIDIYNLGPNSAENVVLTDTLPEGVSVVDIVPSPDVTNGSKLEWHYPLLESGISGSIIITVLVEETAPDLISNVATIESDTYDMNLENNEAIENTSVNSKADLSVVKSDSADPVYPGQVFTYTIEVTNNGPDEAVNVVVTDTLPSGVSYVDSSPNPSITIDTPTESILKFNLPSLLSGETKVITINVSVDTIVPGTITNTVNVVSDTFELDDSDNNDNEDTTIEMAADLSVVKSDNKDPAYEGDLLTYSINVTNNGPNDAVNVEILDVLPSEVTFVNATPLPSAVTSDYHWNVSSLSSGESYLIEINVTVNEGVLGIISNTASVSSDTDDLVEDNNEVTEETLIMPKADLEIVKLDSDDNLELEASFSYILNVTNLGPNTAENVNISDNLPSEVSYVNATIQPSGNDNSMYYWIIPSLDFNESVEIRIEVKVNDGVSDTTISNTGFVSSDTFDPISENNQDIETTTIKKKESSSSSSSSNNNQQTTIVDQAPTADAGGPYRGFTDEEIDFDGSGSSDSEGDIASYEWDLDNNGEYDDATGVTASNSWSVPGVYTIRLRVTDSANQTDEDSANVTVDQANREPGDLTIEGPSEGLVEIVYNFTINATDPDNNTIQYNISWDDGETITTEFFNSGEAIIQSHNWSVAGTYNITVIAYDNTTTPSSDSVTHTITITEPVIPEEEKDDGFNWCPLILILLLILLLLVLLEYRRRKKKKEAEEKNKPAPKK